MEGMITARILLLQFVSVGGYVGSVSNFESYDW